MDEITNVVVHNIEIGENLANMLLGVCIIAGVTIIITVWIIQFFK